MPPKKRLRRSKSIDRERPRIDIDDSGEETLVESSDSTSSPEKDPLFCDEKNIPLFDGENYQLSDEENNSSATDAIGNVGGLPSHVDVHPVEGKDVQEMPVGTDINAGNQAAPVEADMPLIDAEVIKPVSLQYEYKFKIDDLKGVGLFSTKEMTKMVAEGHFKDGGFARIIGTTEYKPVTDIDF